MTNLRGSAQLYPWHARQLRPSGEGGYYYIDLFTRILNAYSPKDLFDVVPVTRGVPENAGPARLVGVGDDKSHAIERDMFIYLHTRFLHPYERNFSLPISLVELRLTSSSLFKYSLLLFRSSSEA